IYSGTPATISGTGPTVLVNLTQGGWRQNLLVDNPSATTMVTLSGGRDGMVVDIIAANGNTTIQNGTGQSQIQTKSGSDLVLAADSLHRFVYRGNHWYEI